MKTYTQKGWYGEDIVYVFEKIEDFDEYEKLMDDTHPNWKELEPNFHTVKEEFKEYIGKIWQDKEQIRYCLNDKHVYVKYKVIALENDKPNADYYWVVQNVDDDRDIMNILANGEELKNGLK